ncbi:MAG TPA: hypothetical protein VNV39_11895 [Stellaceae bacterium]|jgi:threonine/homoserine efflux transporter RhtA|nr:hypothetical protein [Stellaceae bacterium]
MLVSNLVFVVAIGRVPLATASAIGFTSPLLVTATTGEHRSPAPDPEDAL